MPPAAVDLVEREVEALLPLRAVLRVRAGQRAADAEQDRLGGVGKGCARECCSRDCGGERALDQGSTIDVAHARLHPVRCYKQSSNSCAGEIAYFEGSPSDSISRFAQLKNEAPLMTSTISASSRPALRSSAICVRAERDRRRGQRHRGLDDRVPAFAEIGADAFVEQPLHVVAALGIGAGKARMHRGAVDAAVVARGRRRRELTLGARQAVGDVVEDVLVGLGAGFQHLGIAHQQAEILRLGAGAIDQAGEMPLGQLGLGQRLDPGAPSRARPG